MLGYIARLKAGYTNPEYEELKTHWENLPESSVIFVCPVTVGEIEYGLRTAVGKKPHHEKARQLYNAFACMDINLDLAREYYAELRSRLFKRCHSKKKIKHIEEWEDPTTGRELEIDENDLWIAAVAMAHNLVLVTHDKMTAIKDVAKEEIKFEDWMPLSFSNKHLTSH
jgi:predicted nucleic acid-binding protein